MPDPRQRERERRTKETRDGDTPSSSRRVTGREGEHKKHVSGAERDLRGKAPPRVDQPDRTRNE